MQEKDLIKVADF